MKQNVLIHRRKNAKALWLEESECLAKEKVAAAAKASRLDKEQAALSAASAERVLAQAEAQAA